MVRPQERGHSVRRTLLECIVVFGVLLAGCYIFLYPASKYLLDGRTDAALGDGGGDAQSLPFQYNVILETVRHRPRLLFYGSVFSPQLQAPLGSPQFITWIERLVVALVGLFERRAAPLITLVACVLITLNGASMYLFARTMRWPFFISLALTIAWAFNPYTHARIGVHMPLGSPFIFPLLFTGMRWIHDSTRTGLRTARTRNLRVGAAAIFVFAFFAAHYYWFVVLLMSPLFLMYFVMTRPEHTPRRNGIAPLALSVLPAIAFLAWNVLVPAPSGMIPKGQKAIAEYTDIAIVYALAAKPADFLAGDIRFGLEDRMPGRKRMNEWVALPDRINTAESVNGIRWVLLFVAAVALLALFSPQLRRRLSHWSRRALLATVVIIVFSFFLSLRPDFLAIDGEHVGLTRFTFAILPYFRCPCRAGTLVHFAILVFVGVFTAELNHYRVFVRWPALGALVGALFAFAVTMDTWPNALQVSPLRRPRTELQLEPGYCGSGVIGPADGAWEEVSRSQELYGTSCNIVPTPANFPVDAPGLTHYASCGGLSWFVYNNTPVTRAACEALGWQLVTPDSCRSPVRVDPKKPGPKCVAP